MGETVRGDTDILDNPWDFLRWPESKWSSLHVQETASNLIRLCGCTL